MVGIPKSQCQFWLVKILIEQYESNEFKIVVENKPEINFANMEKDIVVSANLRTPNDIEFISKEQRSDEQT